MAAAGKLSCDGVCEPVVDEADLDDREKSEALQSLLVANSGEVTGSHRMPPKGQLAARLRPKHLNHDDAPRWQDSCFMPEFGCPPTKTNYAKSYPSSAKRPWSLPSLPRELDGESPFLHALGSHLEDLGQLLLRRSEGHLGARGFAPQAAKLVIPSVAPPCAPSPRPPGDQPAHHANPRLHPLRENGARPIGPEDSTIRFPEATPHSYFKEDPYLKDADNFSNGTPTLAQAPQIKYKIGDRFDLYSLTRVFHELGSGAPYLTPNQVWPKMSQCPFQDICDAISSINELAQDQRYRLKPEMKETYKTLQYTPHPEDSLDFSTFVWLLSSPDLKECVENLNGANSSAIYQVCEALGQAIVLWKEEDGQSLGLQHDSNSRYAIPNGELGRKSVHTEFGMASMATKSAVLMFGRNARASRAVSTANTEPRIPGVAAQPRDNPSSSKTLDILVSAVIAANALVMGISADNDPDHLVWEITEYCFATFFVWEMVYKMYRFGVSEYYTGADKLWNWFDTVVVIISLIDCAIAINTRLSRSDGAASLDTLEMMKTVRLSRLGRMIRLLRFKMFDELKKMVQGVFAGLRVLFWAVVLFFFCIYLVAIILQSVVGKKSEPYLESLSTVQWAMFTLFRCVTDGCSANDGTPLQVHLVNKFGFPFWLGYMLVYLFMSIGLFNLIMAIFVENVQVAAHKRRQDALKIDRSAMEVHLTRLIHKLLRKSSDGTIFRGANDSYMESMKPKKLTCRQRVEYGLNQILIFILGAKVYQSEILDFSTKSKKFATPVHNTPITRDLFNSWLLDEEMINTLEDLDIDSNAPLELFDVLDADMSGVLDADEIVEGLLMLRGPPEKSDAVATLLCIRDLQVYIRSKLGPEPANGDGFAQPRNSSAFDGFAQARPSHFND